MGGLCEAGVGIWVSTQQSHGTSLAPMGLPLAAPLIPPSPPAAPFPGVPQVFLAASFHLHFGPLWIFLFPFSLLSLSSPRGDGRVAAVLAVGPHQRNVAGRRQ